jgi:hypothetical protein
MGFFGSADRNRSGQPQPHRQRKLYTEQTSWTTIYRGCLGKIGTFAQKNISEDFQSLLEDISETSTQRHV